MAIDKQLNEIDLITKKMEKEKNFDALVADFAKGAELIKNVLCELKDVEGKITEIIKEVDQVIEQEIKIENEEE